MKIFYKWLMAAILLTSAGTAWAASNPFSDTSMEKVSGQAAAFLYKKEIIKGYPDGEFKGSQLVNRAEAAKFLLLSRYKPEELPELKNSGQFHDIKSNQWYTSILMHAIQKGIMSGYPDHTIKPTNPVNTAEFLKMLTITFNLPKYLESDFTDVSEKDWFFAYAGIVKEYQLMPGRSKKLLPDKPMTRDDVAIAIYRYLK